MSDERADNSYILTNYEPLSLINLLNKLFMISYKNAIVTNFMTTCLFSKYVTSRSRDGRHVWLTMLISPIFVFPTAF